MSSHELGAPSIGCIRLEPPTDGESSDTHHCKATSTWLYYNAIREGFSPSLFHMLFPAALGTAVAQGNAVLKGAPYVPVPNSLVVAVPKNIF